MQHLFCACVDIYNKFDRLWSLSQSSVPSDIPGTSVSISYLRDVAFDMGCCFTEHSRDLHRFFDEAGRSSSFIWIYWFFSVSCCYLFSNKDRLGYIYSPKLIGESKHTWGDQKIIVTLAARIVMMFIVTLLPFFYS